MIKNMKNKLLILLIIFVLIIIVGCSTVSSMDTKVPVILFADESRSNKSEISTDTTMVAFWDIKNGQFNFEQQPLFKFKKELDPPFQIIWDGSKNILLNNYGYLDITDLNKNYNIKQLTPPVKNISAVIHNLSEQNSVIIAAGDDKRSINFEMRQGKNIQRKSLIPPIPSNNFSIPYPLMLFGSPDDYTVLVAYDVISNDPKEISNTAVGKLIVGNIRKDHIQWKEVEGNFCGSFIASGADLTKVGNKIYFSSCDEVKELDIASKKAESKTFNEANLLIDEVRSKYKNLDFELTPFFGGYKDILLMGINVPNEKWIWALQNGRVLGTLHFYIKDKKITVYKNNKKSIEEALPVSLSENPFILPKKGFST